MSMPGKFGRSLAWIGGGVVLLIVCWIGLLAFPQPLCPHHVRAGSILLYYDDMPGADAEELARAVAHRLKAGGYYDSIRTTRVFLFWNSSKYALITRLAAIPGEAQGFILSYFRNTFISAPRVAALGDLSDGRPKYSVWEGDLSHTIAHEIAHQYAVDRIGRRELPQWKREGIAEHIANIGLIRGDSTASLLSRLRVFDNNRNWSATDGWDRQGWDRIHYEAGLLVEFLVEIEGYAFQDVAADSVTLDDTRASLHSWAAAQYAPTQEL